MGFNIIALILATIGTAINLLAWRRRDEGLSQVGTAVLTVAMMLIVFANI